MKVQLISPEKILFEGVAAYVQIPGISGEFGVLPSHAPFISTLKEGTVAIDLLDGSKQEFPVTGGVAEVQGGHVVVLVE